MKRNIKIKAAIIVGSDPGLYLRDYRASQVQGRADRQLEKEHPPGLDLSGGTQLVMEVQLQDAFKAFADTTIDRLKEELKKDNIDYARH